MTTATETATQRLAGDICPPWCGGEHRVDREAKTHGADRGVWHHSPIVDQWMGEHPDSTEPLTVRVEGYRHDDPDFEGDGEGDWPDEIRVEGSVFPGYNCSVELCAADARRLGQALVLAADLAEGKA